MKKTYYLTLERNNDILDDTKFDDADDMYTYLVKTLPYEPTETRAYVDEVDNETGEVLSQDIYTWENNTLYVENTYTAVGA